jgi:hypothetical protein
LTVRKKWNAAGPVDDNDGSDDSSVDRSDEVQSTFGKMLTESGISLDNLFPAEGAMSVEPISMELDSRLQPVSIDVDSSAIVPNQLVYASGNVESMDEKITERQPTYLRKVSNQELFGIIEPDANVGLDTELAGSSQDAELSGRRSDRAPAGEVENRRQAAAGVAKSGIAKSLDYVKSLPRELVISLLLLFGCLGLIAWNGQRLEELRLERPQATTPVSSVDPRANIDSSVGKPSFSVPKAIFDPLKNPDWQLQTAPDRVDQSRHASSGAESKAAGRCGN